MNTTYQIPVYAAVVVFLVFLFIAVKINNYFIALRNEDEPKYNPKPTPVHPNHNAILISLVVFIALILSLFFYAVYNYNKGIISYAE